MTAPVGIFAFQCDYEYVRARAIGGISHYFLRQEALPLQRLRVSGLCDAAVLWLLIGPWEVARVG